MNSQKPTSVPADTLNLDQLMDKLEACIASPAHQARKTAPEPHFYTYMENLGEVQLFGYNFNRFLTDAALSCEMQLRQKIFRIENFDDDTVFGMDVSAEIGMYFEYTLVGLDVSHQDDGVPHIQSDHPLSVNPDMRLLKPHDFKTSGFMPRIFQRYEDLKKLGKGRLNVHFPTWHRGPLDMAIQLRGYDNFIMDTIERPEFAHDLLKFLTGEQIRWWDAYREHFGIKEYWPQVHDDWINIPFISPALFEEFALPRYVELEAYHGKLPFIHSCGNKAPVQLMLERIKTFEVHEVNHWTDLEATLANVPTERVLSINLLNTEVLMADEAKMRRDLEKIARLCRGRKYAVCAQAIEKVHDDIQEDIAQVKRWLALAREILRPGGMVVGAEKLAHTPAGSPQVSDGCAREAAIGNVQLTGTHLDSGATCEGFAARNLYDGDFATAYSTAPVTNQWTGVDAGAAVTLVRVLLAPRTDNNDCGSSTTAWSRNDGKSVIEAGHAADYRNAVPLYRFDHHPVLSQMQMNPVELSPSEAYRYYRIRSPAGYGDIAELRWIVKFAAGISAQPVAPTISPWGGIYLAGTTTVTLASETTSAQIHYTLDGSTPTVLSPLYSAPFTLNVTSNTVLKAIAIDASLGTPISEVSSAAFRNTAWTSGMALNDVNRGWKLQGFAGQILGPISGKYYRVGQNMSFGPAMGCGFRDNPFPKHGVYLWSSMDLYNWRYEAQILDDGTRGGKAWDVIERPHILYNSRLSKYVLWAHCGNRDWDTTPQHVGIATATNIMGPWVWQNLDYNPSGLGYKDSNLFLDDDGSGYAVWTIGKQERLVIQKLSDDFQTVIGLPCTIVEPGSWESPVVFRRGAIYFCISGPATVYGATVTPSYWTASNPLGPWTARGTIFGGGNAPAGYGAQPTSVFKVPGKVDAYLYQADLWSLPVYQSTHLFAPLIFPTETSLQVDTNHPQWDLSYWANSAAGRQE